MFPYALRARLREAARSSTRKPAMSAPSEPTSTSSTFSWRSMLLEKFRFLLVVVAVCLVAWLFARHSLFFDIITAFVYYQLLGAIVALVGLAALRAWRSAAVAAVLLVWLMVITAPYLPWKQGRGEVHAATGNTVRVLLTNVLSRNRESAELMRMIQEANPDIICSQETDDFWYAEFQRLKDTYPHHHAVPRPDNFGIGLWSKFPLLEASTLELGDSTVPTIFVKLDIHGTTVNLLCLHTLPPLLKDYAETRNLQLADVPGLVEEHGAPFLLVGDLNASLWSPYVKDIRDIAGLRDAREGFGIFPTWPANVPLIPAPCPIDQILVSPEIEVTNFERGPFVGSDHYPVWADVIIPPGPETAASLQ